MASPPKSLLGGMLYLELDVILILAALRLTDSPKMNITVRNIQKLT